MCNKCNKHKATVNWVGDGGVMEMVHGMSAMWCECCVMDAQIEYAQKAVDRLKDLKKKRKELTCD